MSMSAMVYNRSAIDGDGIDDRKYGPGYVYNSGLGVGVDAFMG